MCAIRYQGDYFSVHTDDHGNEYVASRGDEVLVVPVTAENEVILTIEPAPAFNELVLILPGGEVEAGVLHAEVANRELQEEVGYAADRVDFMAELRPFSKYLAVSSFVYLARDLTPASRQGDEPYEIRTERVPFDSVGLLIASGRLRDARAIAALFLAQQHLAADSS